MSRIGAVIGVGASGSNGVKEALGAELITNGDFSNGATGWTVEAGWTITGGKAVADGTGAVPTSLIQGAGAANSTTYRLTFDVSGYVSGTLDVVVGTVNLPDVTSNGTYSVDFTTAATQNGVLFLQAYTFIGEVDNVSLREIL